jgi:hypothetical protein
MEPKRLRTTGLDEPVFRIYLLKLCTSLQEGIQATGTPEFGDRCLDNILSVHPLKRLRRFILTDGSSTTDETSETATTGKDDQEIYLAYYTV